MKTRPSTIAADDLTGPPVLQLQRRDKLSGRFPEATPVSAGLPRNISQVALFCPILPASRPSQAAAPRVAARIVAAAAKTQLFGRLDFMCGSLCQFPGRSHNRRRPQWLSTGATIQRIG